MVYSNAARDGRTHHGKIERRGRDDAKFSIEIRPGYRVRMNDQQTVNRAARRQRGLYRGVTVASTAGEASVIDAQRTQGRQQTINDVPAAHGRMRRKGRRALWVSVSRDARPSWEKANR